MLQMLVMVGQVVWVVYIIEDGQVIVMSQSGVYVGSVVFGFIFFEQLVDGVIQVVVVGGFMEGYGMDEFFSLGGIVI